MKQFKHIFLFELNNYLKNKIFIGVTLLFVVVIGVYLFFPRFSSLFGEEAFSSKETEVQTVLLVDNFSENPDKMLSIFQSSLTDINLELSTRTLEELKPLINNEDYESAIILSSPTSYSYLVKDAKMQDRTQYQIDEILLATHQLNTMEELGVSPTKANELLSATIDREIILTGKDQSENFLYTYLLIMALFIAINYYGTMVAVNIASEKSSRAMEVLITSAKPTNLIFGKIIGSSLAGILQLSAILGSAFIFFQLNKSYWIDNMMVNSIFNMPISMLFYTILFFILGFLIYAFLYGAVGSFASKVEEVNTSSFPITLVFMIAFFVVMTSMTSGNMDTPLMIALSYIPLTSPMAMFVRIAMSEIQPIEIILSVAILIITTLGIGYISAKIYRVGVLLYGTPPKFSTIIKAMRKTKI